MTVSPQPSAVSQRRRTLVLTVLFTIAMVTGGWMFEYGTLSHATPVHGARLFENVREHISTLYIDTIPDPRLYHMAVDGLIAQLGDPGAAFLSPERFARFSKRSLDPEGDPGMQIGVIDGAVAVVGLFPGGPAARAGVLRGDRIIEIDGTAAHEWTPDEIQRALGGASGSTVHVTVEHIQSGKSVALTLVRAPLPQRDVGVATLLPNGVAYVALRHFGDATTAALSHAVDSLRREGARSLVLDLRATRGGTLERGVQVAGLFLDRGLQVVHTRGRIPGATHAYVNDHAPHWPHLLVAVLVDGTTARAAELLAGALQDHDRAVLLGRPTAGEGNTQESDPLDSAGALLLTTIRWYTPAGRSLALPSVQDDAGVGAPADTGTKRPEFETDAGRTVLGGGGIVPDLLIGDTVPPTERLITPPHRGNDTALLAAWQLLSESRSQQDVLDRAARMAHVKKPTV